MRIIDADSLKAKKTYSHERHEFVVPVAEIDWMPTVDAVQVVRCKECRFFKPWDNSDYGKCKTGLSVMGDMFCSCGSRADGERRTDDLDRQD